MLIETLWQKGELSNRAYNVCRRNRISSTDSLKEHYTSNGGFKRLSNCGEKTEKELIKFLKFIFVQDPITATKTRQEADIIKSLSQTQKEVIELFISISLNSLANRNRNAVHDFVIENDASKTFSLIKFGEKILYNPNFHITKLKNIGKRSMPELQNFIKKVNSFVDDIVLTQDEQKLIYLRNKFVLERHYGLTELPEKLLNSESFFPPLEFIIKSGVFFKNPSANYVFINGLDIFREMDVKSLEKMAEEADLSFERVRQLRKICLSKLEKKLEFFGKLNPGLIQEYEVVDEEIFIRIPDLNKVNCKHSTHFSDKFLFFIYYIYHKNAYTLIGDIEQVFISKNSVAKNKHSWKHFYLLKREYSLHVDFNQIINDIYCRINSRIEETYSLNIKSYILSFNEALTVVTLSELSLFLEFVVTKEAIIEIDLNDNLVFKRNTARLINHYALEVIEELGKPAKLSKIQSLITQKFPDLWIGIDSLRSSLLRDEAFVALGRRSIYGLKKWEIERDNFKGGTIRTIVEEYLEESENPIHISEITEQVLKYRANTSSKSILHNLKLDDSQTFEFFKNSFIGLKRKTYQEKFQRHKNTSKLRKSWNERLLMLKKFIENNERLPFSSGEANEENTLNRWYNLQLKRSVKGELNQKQVSLLGELENYNIKYKDYQSFKDRDSYKLLIAFIDLHQRPPSPSKEAEESLYRFYYRIRKLDIESIENSELQKLYSQTFTKINSYEY